MKCKNCGGVDFVPFASHYECVYCGQKWVDDVDLVDLASKDNESVEAFDPNEALYKTLIGYTEQVRLNEALVRGTLMEILKNDSKDRVAQCVLAYLDRNEYPENYKDAIKNISAVDLDGDTEKWICTFLIENSEYKYFDSIVDMLFDRNAYSDYSQLLTDAKNRLELANENYSNLPRDIFVCHSSNDADAVDELVERLEADGNTCWYAKRNMPQNSLLKIDYKARIAEAISNCKVFLVVMSQNSLLSDDVKWELDIADDYGIDNRIEYRIEDVENTTRFKHFFDGIQWIDAVNEKQYHTLLSRVYDMLHRNVEDECDVIDYDDNEADDENEYEYEYEDESYEENKAESDADESDLCSDRDDAEDIEAQALELFEMEEYDKAFALLDTVEEPSFGNLTNFYIGICFEKGYGSEVDVEQAEYFYALAENGEEKGDDDDLGRCFYFLAMKYAYGELFERSDKRAFELFAKASGYKNVNATFNLGICYNVGRGTVQDHDKAFECFMNVAPHIPEKASYQLGICFDEGLGTYKDPKRAVEYYREAAELDNPLAMTKLGDHYYYGNGLEQSYEKAVGWYKRAAELGNAIAQYNLGQCYFSGVGIDQDFDFAREWLEKSANNGNKKAAHFIIDNF